VRAAYKPAGGEWQAPVDVSTPGEEAQFPRVALDADGDALVLWGGSTGELGAHAVVQAAYRPAGGSWEAPTDISEDGGNAFPSDVAFDADGNAAVVWTRSNVTHSIVQAAYKPAGQSWEAPTDLSEEGKDAMDAVVVLGAPGISSAAKGVATALWTSAEGEKSCGKESACFSYTVQAAGYDGFEAPSETLEVPEEAVVGAPVEISVPPENIWSPKIEFGDGASASGTSATHTYAAPGEYTVTFSGTEVLGYESRAQRAIVVGTGEEDEEPDPKGGQPGDSDQGDPGHVTSPGGNPPAQAGSLPPAPGAAGAPVCPGAKAARERVLRRLRSGGASRKHAAALRKAKRRLAHCVARHTG
jgi:PKD domain